MTDFPRRDFLKLAFAGALAAAGDALAAAGARAESLAPAAPFAADNVIAAAHDLAKAAFKPPRAALPEPFPSLNFDQYSTIRRAPGADIWGDVHAPFTLEPLHRGFLFTTPVDLFLVEDGAARKVEYDRAAFDFGKLDIPAKIDDIGFSGVKIRNSDSSGGGRDVAIFQGATFFRSLARGQTFGLRSRGLSIRTGDSQGEEFPFFRSLWIERPSPAADTLIIHALLDSASVTGGFRFTLHDGEATIIDTELTLFARADVDHLGLGSIAGAYLFGALDHLHTDDVRSNVHDLSGLQIWNGSGEWIWRPVANRTTLQISAFGDKNPRGFGMLQRNRNFAAYGDDDTHWEKRPSPSGGRRRASPRAPRPRSPIVSSGAGRRRRGPISRSPRVRGSGGPASSSALPWNSPPTLSPTRSAQRRSSPLSKPRRGRFPISGPTPIPITNRCAYFLISIRDRSPIPSYVWR